MPDLRMPVMMSSIRWLALLTIFVPSRAMAFELSWEAPAGCPAAAEIEANVARIVGLREKRPVTVRALAREVDGGWRLDLHTRTNDEEGERELRGASCAEVASAAVVVIALTIDPEVMALPPPPPPLPPPPPPPPPPAPPPRTRALFATLRLVGGAAFAAPPGVAPRVALSAGVRSGRFAAGAGVSFAAETSVSAPSLPDAGGAF
jgi:hypothetical protein